jgi:hypothetical protein
MTTYQNAFNISPTPPSSPTGQNRKTLFNFTYWRNDLEKVKTYIDTNSRLPSPSDDKIRSKILGSWVVYQQTLYATDRYEMKNILIKTEWESFVKDSRYSGYFGLKKQKWFLTLKKLKKYIDENSRIPLRVDLDPDCKQLGSWILIQQTIYSSGKCLLDIPTFRYDWESFVNDSRYSGYF